MNLVHSRLHCQNLYDVYMLHHKSASQCGKIPENRMKTGTSSEHLLEYARNGKATLVDSNFL